MSEYNHWLDESSDADDFERAVLRSGLEANPPEGKEAEVAAGIANFIRRGKYQ